MTARPLRMIAAVAAGVIAFAVVAAVAALVARWAWPGYAAAVPGRSYTLAMLIARLGAGALATLAAGRVAARIAAPDQRAAGAAGLALLAVSLPWHVHIWSYYPVWYHLTYLGYLLPLALLGGRPRG